MQDSLEVDVPDDTKVEPGTLVGMMDPMDEDGVETGVPAAVEDDAEEVEEVDELITTDEVGADDIYVDVLELDVAGTVVVVLP